jgi:hypothetical protein
MVSAASAVCEDAGGGLVRTVAKVLLVACLLSVATGCASLRSAPVKPPSDAFAAKAREFRPPPGWAAVYVIRPFAFVAAGSTVPVFLDRKPFGKLPVGTFLYAEVAPREHVLELAEVQLAQNVSLRFAAEEGKCHFFRATYGTSLSLEPLPEAEGRPLVGKYDQSGDNQLDYGREIPKLPGQ